ncbi:MULTISPECIES: acetyl-CoA carboxylase biotin carboxyl carrier protein [Roseomonadaceae]|jgi:acetyl-CoA carboxylase biotin carboxyl carrier protein|uniref:Biotin carboxyl carrier protein of acetyl-CoA carboxylase n=1 Tax=Falsiroseomonas oleicola TaxID=2801474 RepID=A0ABS6H3M1_9PROT|nr:acetyl-CoA carboxylase biotin carboxyl carrier protein [Roseomonas oleicola]MBU8543044.1 acetyl-CoA carboxylase biotin carboxyl carrier protein [Roseomonas oleicola]
MSGVQFDAAAIRELAKILRETDLTEIELVEKDSRIRVARQITVTQVAQLPAAAAPLAAAPAALVAPDPAVADAAHPGLITSPMVGVAYLSPEPGAAQFVTLGAKVAQGQTLMLIEAMKTFNQIRAPRAGTVTRILVDGGSPVEFGEPLMIIE